jgi:hypothetical protein
MVSAVPLRITTATRRHQPLRVARSTGIQTVRLNTVVIMASNAFDPP